MSCKICEKYETCTKIPFDYEPCNEFISRFNVNVDNLVDPKIFEAEMIMCANSRDVECSHSDMDDLMCSLLRKLGYSDGVTVFEKADKWYS